MQKKETPTASAREWNEWIKQIGATDETGARPQAAAALSALCAAAKQKAAREYIDREVERESLYAALLHGENKARKNAARLIGALLNTKDEDALLTALMNEQTRMVRPSILLALGAAGTKRALAVLDGMQTPMAKTPEEEKHAHEEAEALRRAKAKLSPMQKHSFSGLTKARQVELRAPAGFSQLLHQELKENGISAKVSGTSLCYVVTRDVYALFQARCFEELLFPLARDVETNPKAVAHAVKEILPALLQECHQGEAPFYYRVEYGVSQNQTEDARGKNRVAFITELVAALDGDKLVNNPSGYEAELRIEQQKNGLLCCSCKLYTIPDTRFTYRKKTVSASMHPATAACVARYAATFAPEAKRILDPCCGSGTLLIEWAKRKENAHLTGIDIAPGAIVCARENIEAAGLKAGLLQKDCTGFIARDPYELILCNLPFGNRVGTHKDNERLYHAIVQKLPNWLSCGGVAVFYTMEYTLMKKCLSGKKELRMLGETRTWAGGLTPHVLCVRLEK